MSPERKSPIESIAQIALINPEQFSYGCDSLVDYQVPEMTYLKLSHVLSQGRNVVLLTNHQSYFELETQRHFSQQLKNILGDEFESILLYSAPAVEHNIGPLLQIRNFVYQNSGLNLLGIIRNDDYTNPIYKDWITPEMKKKHKENIKLFNSKLDTGGNLIIFPYESSLEGGRIDPQTQKIKGLQLPKPDCLNVFVNRNALILPCGIDGSYRLINPKTHHPSPELVDSILFNKSQQKLVTFKTGSLIDPQSQKELGFSFQDISQDAIIQVAKLLSPDARGVYSQYVSAK